MRYTSLLYEGAALSLPKLALNGEGYGAEAAGRIDGLTLTGRATALVEDMAGAALLAGRPLAGRGVATVNGTANLLAGSLMARLRFPARICVCGTGRGWTACCAAHQRFPPV